MPAFNDITKIYNAATMGFFVADRSMPFYYRYPLTLATTAALAASTRGYGGWECNTCALSAIALIPSIIGFTLDYFVEIPTEVKPAILIGSALILNIINKTTRCLEDDDYIRALEENVEPINERTAIIKTPGIKDYFHY